MSLLCNPTLSKTFKIDIFLIFNWICVSSLSFATVSTVLVWESDSSSDDSHNTSRSPGNRPTIVKVVRSKPKKLVRKSTSKKLKRGNTNRNLLKKQKSLSQNALSRGTSGKIKMKSKSNSRAKLERQGTSRKWKNENQWVLFKCDNIVIS